MSVHTYDLEITIGETSYWAEIKFEYTKGSRAVIYSSGGGEPPEPPEATVLAHTYYHDVPKELWKALDLIIAWWIKQPNSEELLCNSVE